MASWSLRHTVVVIVAIQIVLEVSRRPSPSSIDAAAQTSSSQDNKATENGALHPRIEEAQGVVAIDGPRTASEVDPAMLYPPSLDFPLSLQRYNHFPELQLPFNISKCKHVYLDLGTNRGRQLRKLYFGVGRRSKWSKLFTLFFNKSVSWRRRNVCAVGVEPDRNHNAPLEVLQEEFDRQSITAHIIRNPVWVNNDMLTFNSIYDPNNTHDASTLSTTGYSVYDHVTMERTTKVNLTKVQLRGFRLATLLSILDPDAVVVAKLDVEGAEHRVLTDLILSGGTICRVNLLGVENHKHLMVEDAHHFSLEPYRLYRQLQDHAGSRCSTTWVRTVDDET